MDKTPFERPPAPCAHMSCGFHASARIKTATGYANLCHKHYLAHFQDRAEKTCVELGLLTATQCREWLRENKLRLKKFSEAA